MGAHPQPGSASGKAWLDTWLAAQGRVAFEMAWIGFTLGQLAGVAHQLSKAEQAEALAAVEKDITDLEASAEQFVGVTRDLLANIRTNLEKAK